MQLNKFLGFHTKDVMDILKNEGYFVDKVDLIVPPREERPLSDLDRIVRIDEKENKILRIIVC